MNQSPDPSTPAPAASTPTAPSLRSCRIQLAVYWILLAIGSHLPQLIIGEHTNQVGVFQIDKTLHVIAFALLTWLLYRARLFGSKRSGFGHVLIATGIATIYALIDEYTQGFTGRNVSLSDIVAGLIGILGVFLILTAPPPRPKIGQFTKLMRSASILVIALIIGIEFDFLIDQFLFTEFALMTDSKLFRIGPHGRFYLVAVVTLMFIIAKPLGQSRPGWGIGLSIIAIGLAGPIIESVRPFAGHDARMADLYAHQLGLLAAMTALSLVTACRAFTRRRPAHA